MVTESRGGNQDQGNRDDRNEAKNEDARDVLGASQGAGAQLAPKHRSVPRETAVGLSNYNAPEATVKGVHGAIDDSKHAPEQMRRWSKGISREGAYRQAEEYDHRQRDFAAPDACGPEVELRTLESNRPGRR